ncbi:MAG TPA: hypothetical protein VNQ76_04600, partial [Planctomicrobium sp.]|nr:hypothetical protein [Planctomicrobium sp.]
MTKFKDADVADNESVSSEKMTNEKPRRGWSGLFWGILLLIGGLVLFLPTVLSNLCTSPEAVAWISGQPAGRVMVGRAQLGWQSPVLLRDVIFNDDKGRPLAQVDSVTTKRSFWDMLMKPKESLNLTLDGLKLTVVVKDPTAPPEGTINLRAVADTIQRAPLPILGPDMDVTITNGQIEFRTPNQDVIETWTGLNATYHAASVGEVKQSVKATIPAAEDRGTGELSLQFDRAIAAGPESVETIKLSTTGDRVSLRPAQAWIEKYLGAEQALKQASGTIQALFERNPETGWQFVTTTALKDPTQENLEFHISMDSRFSAADDRISLSKFDVTAQGTSFQLKGDMAEVSGSQLIDLSGSIQTPTAPLLDLLPEELRRELQITGMKVTDIALKGALAPQKPETPPLAASMVVQWDQAAGYGLVSPRGQVRIAYQNGLITPTPLNVTVNGGRLLTLPTVDLNTTPAVVRFQPGLMLENVALTEELCRSWVMYVSPTLAEATSAEGRFSLAMNEGVYVIGAPEQSQLSGRFAISQGKVRPGPLAMEVFQNVGQLEQIVRKIGSRDLSEQIL